VLCQAEEERKMRILNEVVSEKYRDAAKEKMGSTSSCCGPSCCSAESTSGTPKEDLGKKHGDAATQAAKEAKSSCCGSSCCATA
jgi:hypothetical protein